MHKYNYNGFLLSQEANMYPVQSWLTWSQEPWTPSDPAHSDRSSDQTTLSLDRVELETTGPRDTTQKELNWSTLF